MRNDLFCYGTLQFPEILQALIGRRPESRRAAIHGYGAFQVRHADYPGLRRAPDLSTCGQVIFDLTAAELAILDRFEGRLYQRRRLTVCTRDGRRRATWVYVVKPAWRCHLLPRLWRRREFKRRCYGRFLRRYAGAGRTFAARRDDANEAHITVDTPRNRFGPIWRNGR